MEAETVLWSWSFSSHPGSWTSRCQSKQLIRIQSYSHSLVTSFHVHNKVSPMQSGYKYPGFHHNRPLFGYQMIPVFRNTQVMSYIKIEDRLPAERNSGFSFQERLIWGICQTSPQNVPFCLFESLACVCHGAPVLCGLRLLIWVSRTILGTCCPQKEEPDFMIVKGLDDCSPWLFLPLHELDSIKFLWSVGVIFQI